MSDDLGTRGEAIFFVLMTSFCGRKRPFFRPHFLGEKFPALDYMVELVDAGPAVPFFFVQVKTTRMGYTTSARRRLRVRVPPEDVARLVAYPTPTYVVGIDERDEVGYVVSVNEAPVPISSLTTRFPLTCSNLEILWAEVNNYWQKRDMTLRNSAFVDLGEP